MRIDIPLRLLDRPVQHTTRKLRSKVARVLLVVPTSSYRIADFIDAAGALGVEVAVAAEEDLPLLAIDRFVRIDCADPVAAAATVVDLAATTSIDAIVPVDDAGVIIAALASESLGLPHNPPAAAAATRNKEAMRLALSRGEVPQPSFAAIAEDQDPTATAAAIGFPLVVKPLSLSGSRGVIKVDSPEQLPTVIGRVLDIAQGAGEVGGRVLLEQFVAGPEVAVEGMLWNGVLEVLAIFDKPDHPDGPYFEETIYVTPSRLDRAIQDEIVRVTQAATTAIGLLEGPIHAELRVEGTKPSVIEVAGRSIGGICGRALSFGLLDTSLETLILRHALGRRRGLPRTTNASGVMMLPISGPGTLTAIGGLDDAGVVEGIDAIEVTAPIGTHLRPVPEADRYLGFIFATGPEADDVVATLKKAHSLLDIVIR